MFRRIIKGAVASTLTTMYAHSQWKTNKAGLQQSVEPARLPQALPRYRPHDFLHLHYAVEVYKDDGGNALQKESDWQLVRTHKDSNSYFGAAYRNTDKKHVIIAHRGTQDLQDWVTDFDFITRRLNGQSASSWEGFAKKIVTEYGPEYSYSFTGHSLGGLLAQTCLWNYQDEFVKGKISSYQDAFAVTLDDPGAKEILEAMQPRVESSYRIAVDSLDITAYLSRPNIVNTALGHAGTTYALFPDLDNLSWWQKTFLYTLKMHGGNNLLKEFNLATGLPHSCVRVVDWPRIIWGKAMPSSNNTKNLFTYLAHMLQAYRADDIQPGEYTGFFSYTPNEANNPENLPIASQFQLKHGIHYRVKDFDEQSLPLRNMPAKLRQFFEELHEYPDRVKIMQQLLGNITIPKDFTDALTAYSINQLEELVVDKSKTVYSARALREAALQFLNAYPQLYKAKLAVLHTQYIEQSVQTIQVSTLPGVLADLRVETQHTADLLHSLSFKQGTARLYKFIRPTWEEMEDVNNEYEAIGKQLSIFQSIKLNLQALNLDKELHSEIATHLQPQEQQLLLAQAIVKTLFLYMQGKMPEADTKLNNVIDTLSAPQFNVPSLDKDVLINRAYNLKAKIAACDVQTKGKAIDYYTLASKLLPNDALTWSNYGGLLTDLGFAQQDVNCYIQAYNCFQKVYPLEQVKTAQVPIVCSGMAYGLILLAQSIEQQKINPSKCHVPNMVELRSQAQALLAKAIAINPNYLNARLFLALLNYDTGYYREALHEVDNALAIQAAHPTALRRKGLILEKLGQPEAAIALLEQAKDLLQNASNPSKNIEWIKKIDVDIESIQKQNSVPKAKL